MVSDGSVMRRGGGRTFSGCGAGSEVDCYEGRGPELEGVHCRGVVEGLVGEKGWAGCLVVVEVLYEEVYLNRVCQRDCLWRLWNIWSGYIDKRAPAAFRHRPQLEYIRGIGIVNHNHKCITWF